MWVMWNLNLDHLEIVLVSVQDRCMVCAKCTIGTEIILDTPDGTPRGTSGCPFCFIWRVLILTQDRCTFVPNVPQAWKSFWTHPIELLGDVGHVEFHFGPFGDSVSVGAR
jgi:hypothetical protein